MLMSMSNDDPEASAAPAPLVVGRWQGPTNAAPYPLSRMAPAFGLVDVAAEIERADAMLATVTHGKLELIAAQIRSSLRLRSG
jgi:hypothetical protein